MITWDNVWNLLAAGLIVWLVVALGVALLIGRGVKIADLEESAAQARRDIASHVPGMTERDLEETSAQG